MPEVDGKHFAYTPEGMKQAQAAREKRQKLRKGFKGLDRAGLRERAGGEGRKANVANRMLMRRQLRKQGVDRPAGKHPGMKLRSLQTVPGSTPKRDKRIEKLSGQRQKLRDLRQGFAPGARYNPKTKTWES